MVRDPGLAPIVEGGVEGPTEAQLMLELGVTLAQGYPYGRPVPKDEFEAEHLTSDISPSITPHSEKRR